jgi:hypothetical protein
VLRQAGPADHPSISSTAWPFKPLLSVPYIVHISAAGVAASSSHGIQGLYDTAHVLQGFQ